MTSLLHCVQTGSEARRPSYPVDAKVKRDVDTSSTEVRGVTPPLHCVWIAWYLIRTWAALGGLA